MQPRSFSRSGGNSRLISRLSLTLLILGLSACVLNAQTGRIEGKITDRETGEPLIGANVELAGTTRGNQTDVNGAFVITNVPAGLYTLKISYIGFATTRIDSFEVKANVATKVAIRLSSDPVKLYQMEIVPGRSEESALSDFFETMKWGNLAFGVPDSMELYQTKPVEMILSLTKSATELQGMMQKFDILKERKVRVSKIMAARLKGTGFKIEPLTEPLQFVDFQGETNWRWEITALQPGAQRLYLTLDAIINIDGRDLAHTVHSLDEEILIHVAWHQQVSRFVATNWQWLWTAVVVPVVGWIWQSRKKSQAKRPKR
jgi:hypothetical protein